MDCRFEPSRCNPSTLSYKEINSVENGLGFSNFLSQLDGVGISVLALLLGLSVASWFLILTKGLSNYVAGRRADAFLRRFWNANSLQEVNSTLKETSSDNAFAELAQLAMEAADDSARHGLQKLAAAGGASEFITRVLRNGIDQEATRIENGLTVIASAGSAAPYIGLFGTVWGIYHALIQIGLSGQGTLDKVAGPVGEALIMTALGLAVAIPAVLAYNAFVRRNRIWLARLDAFAHDLFVLIAVGAKTNCSAGNERQLRVVVPNERGA
jgi:biopolymer transport protein ExbB